MIKIHVMKEPHSLLKIISLSEKEKKKLKKTQLPCLPVLSPYLSPWCWPAKTSEDPVLVAVLIRL
jgi:hypothetical protein